MSAGKDVFKCGYYGDRFYIILEGEVSVLIPKKKKASPKKSKMTSTSIHTKILMKRHRAMSKADDMSSINESVSKFKKRDRAESYALSQISNDNTPQSSMSRQNQGREGFTNNLVVEKDQDSNREMKYMQVAILKSGSSFGELALISLKPRSATIRCLTNCKFAVLAKKYFTIKEDKISEKVSYLKEIPFFKDITKTKLAKFSYFFEEKCFQRGQVIYKEGEECKFVYIVKEGEFDFYKKMPPDSNIKLDYTEYLSQYPQNDRKGRSNGVLGESMHVPQFHISLLGKGKIFGEDDALIHQRYTKSCVCNSSKGVLFYAHAGEFINQLKNFSEECYESMVEDVYSKNDQIYSKIDKKAKMTDHTNFYTTLELCLKMRYKRRKKKISKTNYSTDFEEEAADIMDIVPKSSSKKKRKKTGRVKGKIYKAMVTSLNSSNKLRSIGRETRNLGRMHLNSRISKKKNSLSPTSNCSDTKYGSFYDPNKSTSSSMIRRVTESKFNMGRLSLKVKPELNNTTQTGMSGFKTKKNLKKQRPKTANKAQSNRMREETIASIAIHQQPNTDSKDKDLKEEFLKKHSSSYCGDSTTSIQRSLLYRARNSNFSSLYLSKEYLKTKALNRMIHRSQNEISRSIVKDNYISTPQATREIPFERVLKSSCKRSRVVPIASTIRPRSGRLGCSLKSKF
ncbi:unnamed protein product [Moneuplotes crassus]|uniref:Cyclic nucleotide-binding domain-containing protein n=1 Tax=Euplotes crassus TaxID=5936 RepID=A0AAD1Y0E1_EUPCR|nr:unnamed protein product [Moneuplotes crassus]